MITKSKKIAQTNKKNHQLTKITVKTFLYHFLSTLAIERCNIFH